MPSTGFSSVSERVWDLLLIEPGMPDVLLDSVRGTYPQAKERQYKFREEGLTGKQQVRIEPRGGWGKGVDHERKDRRRSAYS